MSDVVLVSIRALKRSFGEVRAVDGVDLAEKLAANGFPHAAEFVKNN